MMSARAGQRAKRSSISAVVDSPPPKTLTAQANVTVLDVGDLECRRGELTRLAKLRRRGRCP
jgi:hypothetical protein